MKTTITLIAIAVILFCIAGCGPGEPFEIESLNDTHQSAVTTQLASADSW